MMRSKYAFYKFARAFIIVLCVVGIFQMDTSAATSNNNVAAYNINPPASPVRLIFVHHSTGGVWLADSIGGLGIALRDNNYFVSATNYGWSADGQNIGDTTDIGHWYNWFGSDRDPDILEALFQESGKNMAGDSFYSRLPDDQMPAGENEIIMFKSCYPNSALKGSPSDPVPSIASNPLRGQDSSSAYHTVANAKGIYIDLLSYFETRPDKLFIVLTAPPLLSDTYAANARAFNNWLVNDWLDGYPLENVAVFDFYNVLTTNGGDANTNDLGLSTGNHHRWWNNAIQHVTDGDNDSSPNILEYPTGYSDEHPNAAGGQKATAEFITLLNIYYNNWQASLNGTEIINYLPLIVK